MFLVEAGTDDASYRGECRSFADLPLRSSGGRRCVRSAAPAPPHCPTARWKSPIGCTLRLGAILENGGINSTNDDTVHVVRNRETGVFENDPENLREKSVAVFRRLKSECAEVPTCFLRKPVAVVLSWSTRHSRRRQRLGCKKAKLLSEKIEIPYCNCRLDRLELWPEETANLVILSRCTLDLIKTDRSLAEQITPECPCPAWLSGLSALLQSTRVPIIAEGVETEAQAEALRAAGVSMAQGFYFSPPLSAEKLKAYYPGAG